ncbi:MAG: fumarylacetoacetate hydrolase family protein [Planctomycetaceae bacterium]|jgi:2-keto-4-pentenoate hydratase/2-oxohepta-3-ene-1,7-dioic acid hydratase in catechol pathway|nr:fumarylacetoacetate hydrolase family protein [Planctomycetaceae bacterium]
MIVRFKRPDGSIAWGWRSQQGIQDVCAADDSLPTSTRELILRWKELQSRIVSLIKKLGPSDQPLELLCPLDTPGKILCIGLNYRDHAIETNAPIPEEPIVFSKAPSSLIGPEDPIEIPSISQQVDYEAELVVVVGERLKKSSQEQAQQAIFGYTAGNDISARDWQKGKPGKQWLLGKSFDTFAPIGPAIALASSISNSQNLKIQSRLNGQLMQDSSTRELIFSPAMLLSYISQVLTIEPGDLLFTGTPAGVGVARDPQVFLKPGDRIEVQIESIGTLSNLCVEG